MNNQSTLSFLWGGLQPPPPRQPKASTSLYSGNQNTAIYSSYQKPPQSNNQFFLHSPQEGSTANEIFSGRIFFSPHPSPSPTPQNLPKITNSKNESEYPLCRTYNRFDGKDIISGAYA